MRTEQDIVDHVLKMLNRVLDKGAIGAADIGNLKCMLSELTYEHAKAPRAAALCELTAEEREQAIATANAAGILPLQHLSRAQGLDAATAIALVTKHVAQKYEAIIELRVRETVEQRTKMTTDEKKAFLDLHGQRVAKLKAALGRLLGDVDHGVNQATKLLGRALHELDDKDIDELVDL